MSVPAHAQGRLEHLCRYLLRPPLALERLTESLRGQLVFALPHPRADGATRLLPDSPELIEKLTPLIPPPRVHTLRFHERVVLGGAGAGAAARGGVTGPRRIPHVVCLSHGPGVRPGLPAVGTNGEELSA